MLIVGRQYTKEDLYTIFNIPIESRKGSWNTGYVKHKGNVFLFVNIGVAGRTGHDYSNRWDEGNLIWYGKTGSHKEQPLIQSMINGNTKVLVFSRTEDRSPFTYNGIAHYLSHENTVPICITWNISPDITSNSKNDVFININSAWKMFMENAELSAITKEPFYSPIENEEYCGHSITHNKIWLQRVSAGLRNNLQPPFPKESFTYSRFIKCSENFNNTNGKAAKTSIDGTVLYETAFVEFLPMLEWDKENENIIFDPYSTIEIVETIGLSIEEAPNDSQLQQINILKRSRNGQRKLKQNLLKLYNNKCCVTGCDVEVALNACHIEPHRLNGYNDSKNALLLRTDIHTLWDKNLIGIHPITLDINISPKLYDTYYASLANKKLAVRNDLALPSEKLLNDRWRVFLNVG